MSWMDVLKILVLLIFGGFVVSGVTSDILTRIHKGRLELANLAVKATQSHMATYHRPADGGKAPWDV